MYRAKSKGGGRCEVFDSAMRDRAVARLQLETDLRRAVEREEFRLHYQPIVSLSTGQLTGFEALIRWEHPERGLIPPDDFISVAEETAVIAPIGWWVLREACRQMRRWHIEKATDPLLTISVNLSPRQFAQSQLAAEILDILGETGLAATSLKLEITETTIMESTESASAVLAELKRIGVQLAIDDFGTGYSSLSYVHRFPLDALKIDRSFITEIGTGQRRSEIVRAIVNLGHNLGLEVIAEGVETHHQLEVLRSLGCEYGQGYLFSRPIEADAAVALIVEGIGTDIPDSATESVPPAA
jgi:EAL domain-containing protein (putative c-di-GMP-specific phosphodiesterase class I)